MATGIADIDRMAAAAIGINRSDVSLSRIGQGLRFLGGAAKRLNILAQVL